MQAIPVSELKVGMHVTIPGSWFRHPFLRSRFVLDSQKDIDRMTVAEAKRYIAEGHFKPGSMLPKIQAVVAFLEGGGREAIITDPAHLGLAIAGKAGTHVVP